MKKYILFLGALASWAQVQSISDTLTNAVTATPFTGRVRVALNSPGSAQPLYYSTTSLTGWQAVYCVGVTGSDCTVTSAAGVFAASLYANTTITPAQTSYGVTYTPARGSGWNETWRVGVGHTKIYEIRSTTVPSPTAMFTPSQITQAGATSGQALLWNGSAWAPATVGAGTVYTASAVIDVVSVPDGSCVLDTTAVTITGAALGGRPTIGSSFQPPEGIQLWPKVTGPNSIKIEVCNQSGAAYNPASATYYFGVTP